MAVETKVGLNKPLVAPFPLESQLYHRGKTQRVRLRPRRKTLGLKHLVLAFFLIIGFFFLLAQAYYYAISCEKLTVKHVFINCPEEGPRQTAENFLRGRNLGNLLICDLEYLRSVLISLPGIKDARLVKQLPDTLKVEIVPREPKFYVFRGSYQLVDEEGKLVASFSSLPDNNFPLVEDSQAFRERYEEKIETVWHCLKSLSTESKKQIVRMTFEEDGKISVQLAEDPVRIIIDEEDFAEKLTYYLANRNKLKELFGELEYVDLRIKDRVYFKQLNPQPDKLLAGKKEVG